MAKENQTWSKNKQRDRDIDHLLKFPEVQSWRCMLNACQKMIQHLESALLKEGCSLSRFQILIILQLQGPQKPVDLANQLMVSRGNITMFLRRMVEDRLIEAIEVPGKRLPSYHLTSSGRGLLQKILPGHIERIRRRMPVLGKGTLQALQSMTSDNFDD